ncbi:hypothetical protein EK21DRAFT_93413 [Setomelanomma holmii]|uniref:Uncharacterized protein n=1 Tax=Setomelanomma holmii TaxID=210430 RepID=A0A9P4H1Y7_9PLEO|nr:hypothetical protein EK21DRAFT_93413 [Setomelanomma holmii]
MAHRILPLLKYRRLRSGPLNRLEIGILDVSSSSSLVDINTARNATQSPPLLLPLELRTQIYTHALSDHKIRPWLDFSCFPPSKVQDILTRDDWLPAKHRFGLFSTRRHIYSKTALLPYQLSAFAFHHTNDIGKWVMYMTIYPGAKALKNVRRVRVVVGLALASGSSAERFREVDLFQEPGRVGEGAGVWIDGRGGRREEGVVGGGGEE